MWVIIVLILLVLVVSSVFDIGFFGAFFALLAFCIVVLAAGFGLNALSKNHPAMRKFLVSSGYTIALIAIGLGIVLVIAGFFNHPYIGTELHTYTGTDGLTKAYLGVNYDWSAMDWGILLAAAGAAVGFTTFIVHMFDE